jgi:glycosyltransferase involved in cell wall biosynthesis
MNSPKILFISRAFPPVTGGMEKQNYELSKHLSQLTDVKIIANKHGKKALIWFLPLALFKSLWLLQAESFDVVMLGDGLLSPIGTLINLFFPKVKVISIVHGLDVTFNFPGYQHIIPYCLNTLDKIIAVSTATKDECIKRGISKDKIKVIPNGIDLNQYQTSESKENLRSTIEKEYHLDLKRKKVLITVGRLVKRKGHQWFIENVMPKLDNDIIYLVAGTGEEEKNIKCSIKNNALEDKVHMLGWITEGMKKKLLNLADLFIMPNISVAGDAEGFGIVALEASSVGLPVIAANIEGIKDSVKDWQNGYLVKEKNESNFVNKINILINSNKLNKLRKSSLKYVKDYSWDKIAGSYLK